MKPCAPVFAGLLLAARARADPTWPAATDEMEEIVFQLQGHRGRLFSDAITPCNNQAAGPGRVTASEWLRVAFHDMATANRYTGTGGLDASIQFELRNGENTGPGHSTSLQFYANYFTSRSSMADLIAAGTYASVRGCGGPVIPLRLGRKDATAGGSSGVPQPQNSLGTFRSQFDRMNFRTDTEMIQLVACGHTLGGVHTAEFPDLVPQGTGVNGQVGFDTTVAAFDNRVATEYVSGNTTNPLVAGPSVGLRKNSDFKIFSADRNATISILTSPEAFRDACRTILQKMIEVVPSGVTLTEPIVPYMVKPVDMKLTLNSPGSTLLLTGSIRVRTTNLPASSIQNVVLTWKDRNGGNSCGSAGCSTTSTLQGVSTGFDDTFGFFPISVIIPTSSGIWSFTIEINLRDGTSQTYDNNGNSYPMTDGIIYQKPQSCLLQGTGTLTVTALVRNELKALPVTLGVSYLVPRNTANGNPVPALNNINIPMTEGKCVGAYTFYSASCTIPGGLSYNARISVTAGESETAVTDDFNHAGALGGSCLSFTGTVACGSVSSSAVPSMSSTVSSAVSSSATSTQVLSTLPSASSSVASSTEVTTTAAPTPAIKPTVGGYTRVSCWTEGTGVRALSGASFAYDGMTLESCMSNCTGFDYWGTEYGRECYCGSSLHSSSSQAGQSDCNMVCSGDPTEFCGAGNRLELYSTTATRSTSATPIPTGTLSRKPTVRAYTLVGCQTEGTSSRALASASYADDNMTLESCATYCTGYTFFGTEYGRECYCGNALGAGSMPAAESECSMTCTGNPFEYCGAGNRLELYRLTSSSSSSSSPSPSSTTTSSGTAPPSPTFTTTPTVSPYTLLGCYTEPPAARALTGSAFAAGDMTLERCAEFCSPFRYFGTEYASECFCGNSLSPVSTTAADSECAMSCSGNPAQFCGGASRLSLYEREDVTLPAAPSHPSVVTSGQGGKWEFGGCRTEAVGGRALAAAGYASGAMTLEACGGFCEGFRYFGAEYAGECFCGDAFGEGSTVVGVEECAMVCSGDGGQLCGAGNRLSVYERRR